MTASNKYFDNPPSRPEHPTVRAWSAYRKDPRVDHLVVEVRRERDGLVMLPPRLFVFFYAKGGSLVQDKEAPWEPELEDWLIDVANARAVSPENEKLRFSLLLKPDLRPIVVTYGDGFFKGVLISMLGQGPFRRHPEVRNMLDSIHEAPSTGVSRADCESRVDHVLGRAAARILKLYEGNRTQAEEILGGAIALYLDERFNVTNRRLLFG